MQIAKKYRRLEVPYKLSKTGIDRIKQCDNSLQYLVKEMLHYIDISVLCGYRGEVEQTKAYKEGKSNAKFGESPHNYKPSYAVDIAPYPIDWNDIDKFDDMCDLAVYISNRLGIMITLGREFSFKDYPHIELLFWRDMK